MRGSVASLISAAAVIAALFGAAPSAHASGGAALTPPIATIAPTFFGLHTEKPATLWPAVSFGSLAKPNCAQWPAVQSTSTPNSYNWTTLDQYYQAALAHGTTFTYAPGTLSIPSWATSDTSTCVSSGCPGAEECGAPPTTAHEADFKAFFTALAARYCSPIMSFELWNEPWSLVGGIANMSPAQLVPQTIDEENAIRAGCPNATIVSPSFSGVSADVTYMQSYYADGGPTDLNAATIHVYTNGGPNSLVDMPEAINPATGHSIDYGAVKSLISQYFPGKPIWMTEGSWGTGSGGGTGQSQDFLTAAQQAGFIARWYLIQWSMGWQRVDWYEYDNPGFGPLNPGSRSDGSSVPQTAYQQTYNWLVGRQMTAPCSSPTPTANTAVWTCGLSGANGYRGLAAWITLGSQSYTPPNPSSYTQYRDLTGAVHAYSGGAVTITTSPILFEN